LHIELGKEVRELAKNGKLFGSQKESEAIVVMPDDGTHKFGEFHVKDGKLYQQGKDGAEEVKGLSSNDHKRILSFLALKQRYNDVMKGMLDEVPDMTLGLLQNKLKKAYDAFVNSFGNIANSRKQLILRSDPSYIRVSGLERVERKTVDGKPVFEYKPSAVFTERTIRKNAEPKTAGSLEDAAQISLNYRGTIVPEYVAQLVGMPVADAKANLLSSGKFFENPDNGQLETSEKYLSGNIAEKLKAAKEAAKQNSDFQGNVSALEKAMPLPKKIADIGFKLGTTWVPADVVRRWLQEDLGARRVNVTYSREIDQWFADGDFYSVSGYSAGNKDAKDILLAALNLKRLKVFYKVHDKTVFDREATEAANALKNQMSERFVNFVKKNPELAKAVEDEFNTKINIYVNRNYSGTGKDGVYPGAAETINGKPVRMREHQRAVIARAIEGNTLIAHCVGAGKTFSMITIAEELKRLKLANKNLIVVQNATVEQFAQSARDLYPNAAILSVTKRDMEAKNRKRFMMMIANNDWDIIVMPQSQFNMLVDRPEIQQQYMQSKIDDLRRIIEEMKDDHNSRNTVKEIARQMKSLEAKLEHKLGKKKNAEDVVYFDELGIDALFIDEAHAYKKNFFVTKMPQMKGLDRSDSERAMGLTLKINQIMQKTGGRNIYLATGTPITNTLAEAWNMVRYLYQEGEMPFDCNTFDRFASMFTETVSDVEQTAAGNYKSVERFVKFTNLEDLNKFFTSVADVVLPEDLKGVKRPPIKGGAPTNMIVPRGEVITNFMRYLNDLYSWYDGLSGEEKKKHTAMNLQIYTMARKASIDMRLIDASLPDDPNSKLSKCAEMVYQKWKEYAGVKGTQAVFFDLHRNVDSNKREVFNAYDELKRKLVEYGIPENEIAHMDNFTTDAKKAKLFEDVNAGRVRVIIGGTQT
ncbi:MAG: DEAD/DEAH box helicase family protein, partial [Lentisphaeria bacterium]|nr:DEAD/DEAH box helicase family protein [Lentisphaeria bacterium]